MTRNRILFPLVLLMLLLPFKVKAAERFFNLTYEQVKIDSVLPNFSYNIPLSGNYQDSIYTVTLLYPEFIDMSKNDITRYNELSGTALPKLPAVSQKIILNRKQPSLQVSFMPLVFRDGKYKVLVSFMLKVESKALKQSQILSRASSRVASNERYTRNSILAQGRWAKIRVSSSGVYELTESLIKKAGFTDVSKVKVYGYGGNLQNEELVAEELIKYDDLKELATCNINGRRLFYARGPVSWESNSAYVRTRNPYSDYGYYLITQDDSEPTFVDSTTFINSFYPSLDDYHSLYEVDGYSWFNGGRNLFDPEAINAGSSKTIILKHPAGATEGKLYVSVTAGTNSEAEVYLNNNLLSTQSITLRDEYDKANISNKVYAFNSILLADTIKIVTKTGGPIRLDYVSIAWNKPFAAPDLKEGIFDSPEYVYNITNQNHHADPQADMVIIIPTSLKLREQAERLKKHHEQHDSLRVNIVPADELYNEFASGTPDANAYRRYMKMLYDRASDSNDMPKYLLLMGDCVWDNRMLTLNCRSFNPDDYLLCFESDDSFNKTKCYVDDGFFGLLDDGEGLRPKTNDQLDLAIGRFPVTTAAEAKIMVDKTINYAKNDNVGTWQNTLMFMGDDGNQNLHMEDADDAAEQTMSMHPGYVVKKVIWDSYERISTSTGNTYPEVTNIIKQQQNAGALVMDYAGHGAETQLSHETILRLSDYAEFNNKNLPLWITASCDIMPFDGTAPTIGETAVLNSKGGAVAFFGTTRTVYANYNKVLNMAFLRHVLNVEDGKAITIGEAQRRAKNEMITTGSDLSTNKLQYSLLGDPALALHLPELKLEIDSINGISVSEEKLPELHAGSIARFVGHVVDNPNFTGTITAIVRDSRELIVCKHNDKTETDKPFEYYDRTKKLFSGTDSIRNGKFAFTFAVPKDLNYSNGTGLVNVFAVNSEHTLSAHGASEHFTVGGSDIMSNDSIGPSIYCYLNSPSFANGGDVNTTPFFVAQISDKDGINASGSGIGHNMQLVIDGRTDMTYNLNDNFSYDFGSYTSGYTYYSLPALSEGKHKLLFRAWDIQNNSSTTVLDFNVVRSLEPTLFSVDVSRNPAKTTTTFIINHDRTGSNMDVIIEVYDTSGRILWKHSESGVSTSNAYTVDWDLTSNNGNRLETGVYIYRVKIACDGSNQASMAKKLIVVSNK